MQHTTLKWATTTTAVTVALLAGFITPANADTARDAQTTATGTTIYTDPATNSATAVQATTDGVRQLFTLNNADAPTDFTVPLTLPDSAQLVATEDGGYDIVNQT